MKALPWIFGILVVIVIVYFIYNQRQKKSSTDNLVPVTDPMAPNGMQMPNTNVNQNIAPSSTAEVPPVISGASITGASCLNTPPVVGLIKAFKESKPIQFVQRMQIKDTMGAICPEGLRYLVR